MLKYVLCAVTFIYSASAMADTDEFVYPDYLDDEEYEQCVKLSQSYDNCIKDESKRILRDVKILYQNLLADGRLNDWNGSFDENKKMMRDMYESWTAFRNRVCSLNVVVTKYTSPIYEPRLSCTLFNNFLQKDYLTNLLHLLNQKNPRNPYPARLPNADGGNVYLEVDHDAEYKSCLEQKKSEDECIKGEIERTSKQIKDSLATFLSTPTTEKWNNGPDIKNGNLRDMFDSWVAFRNRMCSLTAYVQKLTRPKNPVSFDYCIQFYNESFAALLDNYLLSANSVLDDEIADDSQPEEGGEAEGKSIAPLKRRIITDLDKSVTSDDSQDDEDTAAPQAETANTPADKDKRGRQLPSWAIQQ